MTTPANVLTLPRTTLGRRLLRECVREAGGWDLLCGLNAAEVNWDDFADGYAWSEEEQIRRWREGS